MRRLAAVLVPPALATALLAGCSGSGDTTGSTIEGSTPSPGAAASGASTPAPGGSAPSSPAPSSPAPSSPAPSASNVVGTVQLRAGKPVGGVQRLSIKAKQPATLLVTSDQATEIHVHGADRTINVPANQPTPVDVSQSAPGSYEVEDHTSKAQLVQLRVS